MTIHFLTWSGFKPGGTQVYSSRAHPESSSEWASVCLGGTWLLLPLDEAGLEVFCPPLSIELLSCVCCGAPAAACCCWAAMTADVAAANGSTPPVKALNEALWSSFGHLQFLQTCLKMREGDDSYKHLFCYFSLTKVHSKEATKTLSLWVMKNNHYSVLRLATSLI